MRILHTSDWHLGTTQGATSRAPDHDRFLDWLLGELRGRDIDALLVAGDVFDTMQPSAEAQSQYYRFLGRVAGTGVQQVVIVGGNHDSASRLEAPADVLAALSVHVVGGIRADTDTWERCLVPLRGRSGAVEAICLAVPYVHEFRLGVRTTDLDTAAVRATFAERFTGLYSTLADLAAERWPGLPIVATAHMTVGAARREDYPQEIHQVGTIDGLPVTVFDHRIAYVALGHIHRGYPVDGDRAWYSGSPIAMSLAEAATGRRVVIVDLEDRAVTSVPVPRFRALVELTGSPESLVSTLTKLEWEEDLPPLLYLRAVLSWDDHAGGLIGRLVDALQRHDDGHRPAIVELRELRPDARPLVEGAALPHLDEMTPIEVFEKLCEGKGGPSAADLRVAFRSIASASSADFDEMVARVRGTSS